LRAEFERQVTTLLDFGYPKLACLSEDAFLDLVTPLEAKIPDSADVPFALVIAGVGAHAAMDATAHGYVDTTPVDPSDFVPIAGLSIPVSPAYVMLDVDTGVDTLNVTPDDALVTILERGRSPLTVDEGVALFTHHPDILQTHNAYSMLGSRRGDKRVTAIWNSKGRARLGWCWAGNPHSWLGSASCRERSA
jgi:hypothetical protein